MVSLVNQLTIAALSKASQGYLELGRRNNKYWFRLSVDKPCLNELLDDGWSYSTGLSETPIPLCRFVFPVELEAPYIFRENNEGLYLVKGCNKFQPTKKTDKILRQWRSVVKSIRPNAQVGLTYEKDYELFEGRYLINPNKIRLHKKYYPAAQVMKMCHWVVLMTEPEAIHKLAENWQNIR